MTSNFEASLDEYDEEIDRTYVVRRPLDGAGGFGADIFMHSGVLIRTKTKRKFLVERTEKPHEFKFTPMNDIPDENTTFMHGGFTWTKQTIGHSVRPGVSLREIIAFMATHVEAHEYDARIWNCHKAQEEVRKFLGENIPQSRFITRVTSRVATFVPKEILDSGAERYNRSLASLDLAISNVTPSLERDMADLFSSNHDLLVMTGLPAQRKDPYLPLDLATDVPMAQVRHKSLVSEKASYAANAQPLSTTQLRPTIDNNPQSPYLRAGFLDTFNSGLAENQEIPNWNFQEQAETLRDSAGRSRQRGAKKLAAQTKTHLPGLLGALQNTKRCFEQGDNFIGCWNTGMLIWSAGMLCFTGGAATLIVQADSETMKPTIRVSICGLL